MSIKLNNRITDLEQRMNEQEDRLVALEGGTVKPKKVAKKKARKVDEIVEEVPAVEVVIEDLKADKATK